MPMKEAEIRPQQTFDRYLEIARQDIDKFFKDKGDFVDVDCPACGSRSKQPAFNKLGFPYETCTQCSSLFASPRPSEAALNHYYENGDAVKFWTTDFYRETSEVRREKIFRPRAELVADLVKRGIVRNPRSFVDIGPGYGVFLEEVAKLKTFQTISGIEPAPNMAEVCRSKGFNVTQKPVEAVETGEIQASLATCFEVLEHAFSPLAFVQAIGRTLADGGLMFFTTLTISGFDLQVLWERSKSIYPPHHINLISVEGMRQLVERSGFEVIELSTPGNLDVDIVANMLKEDPALPVPRFVRQLVESTSDGVKEQFQDFLRRNLLSSHIRCIARKAH